MVLQVMLVAQFLLVMIGVNSLIGNDGTIVLRAKRYLNRKLADLLHLIAVLYLTIRGAFWTVAFHQITCSTVIDLTAGWKHKLRLHQARMIGGCLSGSPNGVENLGAYEPKNTRFWVSARVTILTPRFVFFV
jgi:hypothetical protein